MVQLALVRRKKQAKAATWRARNLEGATTTVSDGWSGLTRWRKKQAKAAKAVDDKAEPMRFDMIVSNPPVHAGVMDDYMVLANLIDGAAEWLTPKGELWIVAQVTVPVGSMLAAKGGFASVGMFSDGRFTIWRAAADELPETVRFEIERKRATLFGGAPPLGSSSADGRRDEAEKKKKKKRSREQDGAEAASTAKSKNKGSHRNFFSRNDLPPSSLCACPCRFSTRHGVLPPIRRVVHTLGLYVPIQTRSHKSIAC